MPSLPDWQDRHIVAEMYIAAAKCVMRELAPRGPVAPERVGHRARTSDLPRTARAHLRTNVPEAAALTTLVATSILHASMTCQQARTLLGRARELAATINEQRALLQRSAEKLRRMNDTRAWRDHLR